MTKEQIAFIRANEIHFDLVLNSNQYYQRSHDIAGKVLAIADELTGSPVDDCKGCTQESYQKVWNEYQLSQDKTAKPTPPNE